MMKIFKRAVSSAVLSCIMVCSCFYKCGEVNIIGFYEFNGGRSVSITLNERAEANIDLGYDLAPIVTTWEIDVDSGNVFLRFSQNDGERFIGALKGSGMPDYIIPSGPFLFGLEIGCRLTSVRLYVDRDSDVFFKKNGF